MGGDEATEGGTRMIDDDGDIDEKTMEGLGEVCSVRPADVLCV